MYDKVNIPTELTGCESSHTPEKWLHVLKRKKYPECILSIKPRFNRNIRIVLIQIVILTKEEICKH